MINSASIPIPSGPRPSCPLPGSQPCLKEGFQRCLLLSTREHQQGGGGIDDPGCSLPFGFEAQGLRLALRCSFIYHLIPGIR